MAFAKLQSWFYESCKRVVFLVIVTPETVVRWHRAGFRLYWNWISRHRNVLGRKRISKELRELIFHMVAENPTWGAPRIHGELLKLGFDVSERTVSRWVQRAPKKPEPAQRWRVFFTYHSLSCLKVRNPVTVAIRPLRSEPMSRFLSDDGQTENY